MNMVSSMPYFGYGSNLDEDDWVRFCAKKGFDSSGMVEIGVAFLTGYEMKFHYFSSGRNGGAADVVRSDSNSEVPGALFMLNDEAWRAMDIKEGYPNYYERKQVTVRTLEGDIDAITYTVVADKIREDYQQPTSEYEALIRNGLLRRDLPTTALDKALQ